MSIRKVRFEALDALRGLAILMMVFSGTIPFHGALPGWMYHAQIPPPLHVFTPDLPGLTWVDLVFPMFLFSMGAAIPFSFGGRMDRGTTHAKIAGYLFWRFLGLAVFAVVSQHLRPWGMNAPDLVTWWLALLGMGLMLLVFATPAGGKQVRYSFLFPLFGLLLTGTFFLLMDSEGVRNFSLKSFDIIIMVLANTALGGGILYLLFRKWNKTLWVSFALLAAFFLSARDGNNWISDLYNWSPVSWLLSWNYLKYLLVLIPGIHTGIVCRNALQRSDVPKQEKAGKSRIAIGIFILGITLVIVTLLGLYTRNMELSFIVSIILAGGLIFLLTRWKSFWRPVFINLFPIIAVLIVSGYLLEPLHGGVKKDPATLSYLILTAGLSMVLLLAFVVLIEELNLKRLIFILTGSGKNPMMAYVAGSNLVMPVLALTGIENLLFFDEVPVVSGVAKAIIITLVVGLVSALAARKKFFMRV
jgi:predicted acyltransferase